MSQYWPTIFDSTTCVRKGVCPVTKLRGQSETIESHTLYFEQHGTGLEKIIFIMGLNATSFSWSEQVKHFARSDKYSVLVFDNRGVGNSSVPWGPYTSSGMAEDVIVLLDYVGWKEDIHVVGSSLGGMVAQELATRIAKRIVSLTLCVTKAGGLSWHGFTPRKGISALLRATATTDMKIKIPTVLGMGFPTTWLDSKNPDDAGGRTNRQIQTEIYRSRAQVARPQTLLGSISQMFAASTHSITADRHCLIATSIPKILILTGDEDNLVNPDNSRELAKRMPEAELVVWQDTGHALHAQWPERFNKLLERTFEEGRVRFDARKKQVSPT
ncbi:alpha/beta-hydrolase [Gautieria morchelliformis]|nr:alpha/beta-hydrolase [Gautieria morchelliformis]